MPDRIRIGADAIAYLTEKHPGAYANFGTHESKEYFALALYRPGWLVLESEDCWLLTEDKGFGVREVHWFCPSGARIAAIRRLIRFIFDTSGAESLMGVTPADSPFSLAARVLNRAVGAELVDGVYVLPKARFIAYNRANVNP